MTSGPPELPYCKGRGERRLERAVQPELRWLWPHVDDGVCLDVVHVRVPQAQLLAVSLGGADDAGGDGVLEGKWAADGDHKLPRSQIGALAQKQQGQLCLESGGEEEGEMSGDAAVV